MKKSLIQKEIKEEIMNELNLKLRKMAKELNKNKCESNNTENTENTTESNITHESNITRDSNDNYENITNDSNILSETNEPVKKKRGRPPKAK